MLTFPRRADHAIATVSGQELAKAIKQLYEVEPVTKP